MRFLGYGVALAIMVVFVAPWLNATFDTASYGEDFLTSIHNFTGKEPNAQGIAEYAEKMAEKHGLVAHAKVTVGDPRIVNPNKPDDPDNRIQDVHIEIEVEKKLLVGKKRAQQNYNLAMGGKGRANAWPE